MARTPRNYQGSRPTGKHIQELLPDVLKKYEKMHRDKAEMLFAAWPKIIGERLAPMTKVVAFDEGVIKIKVANSTLMSLLAGREKPRLIKKFREFFPSVSIKDIRFFIG